MKIRACIFDMDGVLVDTAGFHYQAWKKLTLEKFGHQLLEKTNERLKGVSRMASLNIILEEFGIRISDEEEKQALCNLKNSWYVEMISNMTSKEILPGIPAFLEWLESEKIKTAIGSSSKNAKLVLERIELQDCFGAIVDGTDDIRSKPQPDTFLLAADRLEVSPAECIVFEDAYSGVQAAVAGGFRAVGIGDPEYLTNADIVIPGFDIIHTIQIKEYIENIS